MRACRLTCCPLPSTRDSAPAARRISPTSCSRPCATSSADTWRSHQNHRGCRAWGRNQELDDMTDGDLDQLAINTIRTLSIDAVQKAKSGHPGTPMALAPLVYALWNRVMRFDPKDPIWPNRDRFVLSN